MRSKLQTTLHETPGSDALLAPMQALVPSCCARVTRADATHMGDWREVAPCGELFHASAAA